MSTKYEVFMHAFNQLDKDQCVRLVHEWLDQEKLSIYTLYEEILVKALANLTDVEKDPNHKIWKEHVQSSIVRTIIEMAHPFVLAQKEDNNGKKAAVTCPDGEQHELGARMINDYFTLAGIQSYFVGRDTPKSEFVGMINELGLDYVAISVTNYFNLSQATKTMDLIQEKTSGVTLVLGGRAILNNPSSFMNQENMVVLSNNDELFAWFEQVNDEARI